MKLSYEEVTNFERDGYVRLSGLIPTCLVQQARKAINASLGLGLDSENMTKFRAQSYCPEITHTAAITDLINASSVLPVLQSAIGAPLKPVTGGQVALRFPAEYAWPPKPNPHLDGMHSPTNGVPEGRIQNFTALVGILLSPLTADFQGNFTVWPGSHRLYERYFNGHSPEALMKGMPPVDLPPALQVRGEPGDVFLVNYLTGHTAAVNAGCDIRYACFFRVYRSDRGDFVREVMLNPWHEWEGIRDVISGVTR